MERSRLHPCKAHNATKALEFCLYFLFIVQRRHIDEFWFSCLAKATSAWWTLLLPLFWNDVDMMNSNFSLLVKRHQLYALLSWIFSERTPVWRALVAVGLRKDVGLTNMIIQWRKATGARLTCNFLFSIPKMYEMFVLGFCDDWCKSHVLFIVACDYSYFSNGGRRAGFHPFFMRQLESSCSCHYRFVIVAAELQFWAPLTRKASNSLVLCTICNEILIGIFVCGLSLPRLWPFVGH